jgi:hypothetical protein
MKCKLIILAIIICAAQKITAQEKIAPKDFGLTNNVKQVDEVEYEYDAKEKVYKIKEQKNYVFDKGKLVSSSYKSTGIIYMEGETTFTYNSNGQLISSREKNNLNDETYNYTYNNGKLILKKNIKTAYPIETVFEYNNKGYLSKVIKKTGNDLSNVKVYSNYTNAQSYTLLETVYWNNKVSYTTTMQFIYGLKTSATTVYASSTSLPKESTFKYNDKGHLVEEISASGTYTNVYKYDDRGNAFRTMYGGSKNSLYNIENRFLFSKITYNDGLALGIAAFNEQFVQEFDKKSASYAYEKDFNTKKKVDLNFLNDLEDDDDYFLILKTNESKFKVKTAFGTYITNTVNALKAPNGLDLVIYDSVTKKTVVRYNFYAANTEIEKWFEADELPTTASGLYFLLKNNGKNFYIISKASYLKSTSFKTLLIQNSSSDYSVTIENHTDKYVIRDVAHKKDDVFYPFEILK